MEENTNLENIVEETEVVPSVTPVPSYEEILAQIYGEMQTQTELLTEIKKEEQSILDMVVEGYKEYVEARVALGVILVFYIISFCWSCMRQWRKNILKMGE